MDDDQVPTQAMPKDGRKGAPDGVNTQGDPESEKLRRQAVSEATAKTEKSKFGGFLGHGGQSVMGYHGSGQLGDRDVKPGGNKNAGAKTE